MPESAATVPCLSEMWYRASRSRFRRARSEREAHGMHRICPCGVACSRHDLTRSSSCRGRGAFARGGTEVLPAQNPCYRRSDVTPVLQERGYAAVSGSFGQPVIVPAGAGYLPLNLTVDHLPGYTEQEIVVADLAGPAPQQHDGQPVERPGPSVEMVWAPTASGLLDPRPAALLAVRDAMDRILVHGGVFILFATRRFDPKCIINSIDGFGKRNPYASWALNADNWSLLSELQWLSVIGDTGQEDGRPREGPRSDPGDRELLQFWPLQVRGQAALVNQRPVGDPGDERVR